LIPGIPPKAGIPADHGYFRQLGHGGHRPDHGLRQPRGPGRQRGAVYRPSLPQGARVALWGDYAPSDQGEDIVSGLVTSFPISVEQAESTAGTRKRAWSGFFPRSINRLLAISRELVYDKELERPGDRVHLRRAGAGGALYPPDPGHDHHQEEGKLPGLCRR
jgi:hypothetical protein